MHELEIVEVRELGGTEELNALLASGDWVLLSVTPGKGDGTGPAFLYSVGRPYKRPEEPIEWI